MSTPKNIDYLFQKYINNSLDKEEFGLFMEYVKNPEHQRNVEALFSNHWDRLDVANITIKENFNYESELLFLQVMNRIDNEEKLKTKKRSFVRRIGMNTLFKVAAAILFMFGVFYMYEYQFIPEKQVVVSKPVLDPNAITITLADGSIKVISEHEEGEIVDDKGVVNGNQKGNNISYTENDGSVKLEKLVYNIAKVPYGKLLNLELSDGTKVTLNAGTSLKYPIKFIKDQPRSVFILSGEVYFDVTKDKTHPFVVNADNINVEVLGTEFNMSFYPEDDNISTVLVEGSVRLYENTNPNSKTLLTPGHKAAWNHASQDMSINKVDIELYTAWKDGVLLFKKSPYNNIRKKLERQFDVIIENHYSLLDKQVYTATFSKDNSIEDILNAFKEDTPFNYTIKNNLITITE